MYLAELPKAVPYANWYAWCDLLEVTIMRQEYEVVVLCEFGHQRIRRVNRQNVTKPGHGVPLRLKKLADRLSYAMIGKEPQFRPGDQAALL